MFNRFSNLFPRVFFLNLENTLGTRLGIFRENRCLGTSGLQQSYTHQIHIWESKGRIIRKVMGGGEGWGKTQNIHVRKRWNWSRNVVPISDWLTQLSVTTPSETSFTKWCYTVKLDLFFITTAIVATVAEVENDSTLRESCLERKFKKVSRNRPCYTAQRLLKLVSQPVAHKFFC